MTRDFYKLQRFADHLMSDRLTRKYADVGRLNLGKDNAMIFYEDLYYMILPWFELELPVVFPDFSLNKKGISQYHHHPTVSVPFILPMFFGLSSIEFMHCFVVGQACRDLGKMTLKYDSQPQDCGQLLYEFIDNTIARESKDEDIQPRSVLIEKTLNLKYNRVLEAEPLNFLEL